MTYGYWLDRAATALDECRANIHQGLRGGYTRAPAVVAARTGVYRALAHLTFLLTGPTTQTPTIASADYLINRRDRLAGIDPAVVLRTGLQIAARTDARLPTTAITDDALIHQLNQARDALATAGDVLASHLGWRVRGPRTPQGQAIAQGAGRTNAIADIATLTITAIAIDRTLLRWLNNHTASQPLRPLYVNTTTTMTWWTNSNYPATLRQLARATRNDSLIRLLDTAPTTETSTGPHHIRALADVTATLDSTRAWMTQHPREISLQHIRAATGLAYTITTAANHLHIAPTSKNRASRWLAAANSLNGPADLLGPIHPTISQNLNRATTWLHDHATHTPPQTPTTVRDMELLNLTRKLPALAAQLHTASHSLIHRGQLLVSLSRLEATHRGGLSHARTTWRPARPNEPATNIILNCLRNAAADQSPQTKTAHTPDPGTTPSAAPHPAEPNQPSTAEPTATNTASNATPQQHPNPGTTDRLNTPTHNPWQKLSDEIGELVRDISTDRRNISSPAAGRLPPRGSVPSPETPTLELSHEEPDLA